MRRAVPAFLLALLVTGAASAAELRSIEVDYEDGEYSLVSVAWFDAGLDEVYDVFRRWEYSTRFSSTIVESRDLEADEEGRPGFYVRNRGCILFFCKSLVRKGYVEQQPKRWLKAFADPEHSDFRFSNETWTFAEEGSGTRVLYELHMQPDFWVPPGIGPYLIKRKLGSAGGRALDRIEVIAQELAASRVQVHD